jgi:hypothetical protein
LLSTARASDRAPGEVVGETSSVTSSAPARPTRPARRAGAVLGLGAGLGLLLGALLQIAAFGVVELDESGTIGAPCEVAEGALVGGSSGLLVGLVAAVCWMLLRRRSRSILPPAAGAALGAVVALAVLNLLVLPLASAYAFSVCPY